MRIIAGTHRGRVLKTPQNSDIRPTGDKVRQALFNALQHRGAVVDAVVLDGFCGTGALGLEALSQGAAQAIFIDQAKASLSLAEANADLLRETANCQFFLKDTVRIGVRPASVPQATLVFLDPPYNRGLVPQSFAALIAGDWLAPDAFIVCETEKGADLSGIAGEIEFEKTYGDTSVVVFALTDE